MIHQLLNTLYVQTQGAYLSLDHDTLRVKVEEECRLQIPLQHLGALVLFGNVMISPMAMQRCAEEGREVTFLDFSGHFRCRVVGPTTGNVLLRTAQHDAFRDDVQTLHIAQHIVAAKIRNSRQTLIRGARDVKTPERRQAISEVSTELVTTMENTRQAETLDEVRGMEGLTAARYFGVFGQLINVDSADFSFTLRTRRPPRDRVNALLSFLYALLTNDCSAAVQGVGLDPQVGYLHAIRSGRPALALDIMEEFRSGLVDRLALTLINRRQVRTEHFDVRHDAGESVLLNEDGRKIVLAAYQKHKDEPVQHRLLKEPIPLGMAPHIQARLLARYLRGDLAEYHPFLFGVTHAAHHAT